MNRPLRSSRWLLAALSLALLVASSGPAKAGPDTFLRATSNLVWAPIDLVLSPVVAAKSIAVNMQDIDDSTGVRIVYPVPGWGWNTGVQAGGAVIRGISGILELIPGLFLLPFPDAEMDVLYDPADRAEALVDFDARWPVKFGINYTTIPY